MGELLDRGRSFIASIPDFGATIVVPNGETGKWLMDGIKQLRGKEYARLCQMLIVGHHGHCSKLWGLKPHVMIAPLFMLSNVRPETKAEVVKLVHGIQVMAPVIIGIDHASQPDMTARAIIEGGRVESLER